jgi:hypothetical protein
MKIVTIVPLLVLSTAIAQGQDANELEKRLKQIQESFERQQREMRESFERMLREQQEQIDRLKKELEAARTNAGPVAAAPARTETTTPSAGAPPSSRPWSPSDPIRVAGTTQNYINISFDGLFAAGTSTARDIERLELGGHDPKQRGFTVQNLETTLDGKVDPYFRGQANIVLQIDPDGETTIEAEEAYLESMSLPWNLQVKAGQFLTEFGRLNPTHPHTWDFVDLPLVNGRFLGEDGLRNPGARLSWLMPTPFYSELFVAIQNSQGETAFSFRDDHEDELFFGRPNTQGRVRNFGDMLFAPRYAASFDLSDSQTLLAGVSAAFGPNGTGAHADTQIYGADLFWKWKSPNQHGGFPFVTWQTEGMFRRFEAAAFEGDGVNPALPGETIKDYGFYSQVAYGFRKGWVAALRGDYVAPVEEGAYEDILGRDRERVERWRISPNLTYYPSEFSKIRLQCNFDRRDQIGDDYSVWLQFEFLLGSHAAHKF